MRKIFIISFVFLFVNLLQAQDPTFTAFQMQRLELSPAYGGSGGIGKVFLSGATRTSYYPVRGPFKYSSFSIDASPCKPGSIGVGLLFNTESQGDGFYKRNRVSLNLGYNILTCKSSTLSFGIRPGIITQSIDWNEFTFSDQLHPINGIIYTSVNHGAALDLSHAINWDWGLKFSSYRPYKLKYMIGVSAFNFFQPQIGILSRHQLQRRLSLIGALIWDKRNITYKVNFRSEYQSGFNYSAGNVEIIYNNVLRIVPGLKIPMFNSNTYRNNLFPSLMVGYQINPLIMGYISYENNVMGEIIKGKTSSFEIGIALNTESTFCDRNNRLSDLFKFKDKKVSSPLGCPSMDNLKGKIQSF